MPLPGSRAPFLSGARTRTGSTNIGDPSLHADADAHAASDAGRRPRLAALGRGGGRIGVYDRDRVGRGAYFPRGNPHAGQSPQRARDAPLGRARIESKSNSNGGTAAFGAVNRGSNPRRGGIEIDVLIQYCCGRPQSNTRTCCISSSSPRYGFEHLCVVERFIWGRSTLGDS